MAADEKPYRPYAPEVARTHLEWLMGQIEARCTDKETANLLRVRGRFDLEIKIVVNEKDRGAINDEFLVDMKRAMRERTGLLEPVIYLADEEPKVVRDFDPYL